MYLEFYLLSTSFQKCDLQNKYGCKSCLWFFFFFWRPLFPWVIQSELEEAENLTCLWAQNIDTAQSVTVNVSSLQHLFLQHYARGATFSFWIHPDCCLILHNFSLKFNSVKIIFNGRKINNWPKESWFSFSPNLILIGSCVT